MQKHNDMVLNGKNRTQNKRNIKLKRAWILEKEKVVSFHRIDHAVEYESEEQMFWEQIKSLVLQGYRLQ